MSLSIRPRLLVDLDVPYESSIRLACENIVDTSRVARSGGVLNVLYDILGGC